MQSKRRRPYRRASGGTWSCQGQTQNSTLDPSGRHQTFPITQKQNVSLRMLVPFLNIGHLHWHFTRSYTHWGHMCWLQHTKEQISSHQPQIRGKTPISTTTSRDTYVWTKHMMHQALAVHWLVGVSYTSHVQRECAKIWVLPLQRCSTPLITAVISGISLMLLIPGISNKERHSNTGLLILLKKAKKQQAKMGPLPAHLRNI